MTRILLALIATTAAMPAAPCTIGYHDLIEQNRDGLGRLKIGMTREEVVVLMGDCGIRIRATTYSNPYRTAVLKKGEDSYEVLYYLIQRHQKFTSIRDTNAVPIVLKDGRVVGWGDSAIRDIRDTAEKSPD